MSEETKEEVVVEPVATEEAVNPETPAQDGTATAEAQSHIHNSEPTRP